MTTQAQVVVNVSGGIAKVFTTVGEVDVILIDWDVYDEGGVYDYTVADLIEKREQLERIADPAVRDSYLKDMDDVIDYRYLRQR